MGWTVIPGSRRKEVIRDLKAGWESERGVVRCLAAQYKGSPFKGVLYGVFESTPKPREGAPPGDLRPQRWLFVALLEYFRGHDGWGYKDMDETCHPYNYNCPEKYLAMAEEASPSSGLCENARGYRDGVRAWHARRREALERVKRLKPGDAFGSSATGRNYAFAGRRGNSVIGDGLDGLRRVAIESVREPYPVRLELVANG